MSYKLGNIHGKAALVKNDNYYDLSKISYGEISNNPSEILSSLDAIKKLYADIDNFDPSGN